MRHKRCTQEEIKVMKKLRQKGWSYEMIAQKFGVSSVSVIYNTDANERAKALERAEKYRLANPKKYREYHRLYQREYARCHKGTISKAKLLSAIKTELRKNRITKTEIVDILKGA